MKRRAQLKTLLLLALLLLPLTAAAQEPSSLKVSYLERPPYYWTENGQPKGFLLELTKRILEEAGVPATYVPLPPNRILEELRQNQSPTCSIGWVKNPERETFANFSLPIYRGTPMVVLTTRALAEKIAQHDTLADIFWDKSLVMARMASFSYGSYVDNLLQSIPVRSVIIPTTNDVLPKLLLSQRASYMLVAPEEIPNLLRSAQVDASEFVALHIKDIPSGTPRYLIFSKNVPQSMIEDINAAITTLTDQQHLLAPSPH